MQENKKHKQYAIVKFKPAGMTNTVVIQFYGGAFKLEEKKKYTEWLIVMHDQSIVEANYDTTWEECQEIRSKDEYIDITTCSRRYYKYLQQTGEIDS